MAVRVAHDASDLVALAVELADHLGLERVSIQLLADRAGTPINRVYRHIRNRSDLLGAMAEHVLDQHRPSHNTPPGSSRRQLEDLARHEWAMYRRHRWLLTILATHRPPTGTAVLAMVDRVVAALTDAGMTPPEAYRAYLVLSGYVQGMALLITDASADTDYRAWRAKTSHRLERTGRLGQRSWLTAASHTDPTTDLDTWFEFGLQRILNGLLL